MQLFHNIHITQDNQKQGGLPAAREADSTKVDGVGDMLTDKDFEKKKSAQLGYINNLPQDSVPTWKASLGPDVMPIIAEPTPVHIDPNDMSTKTVRVEVTQHPKEETGKVDPNEDQTEGVKLQGVWNKMWKNDRVSLTNVMEPEAGKGG